MASDARGLYFGPVANGAVATTLGRRRCMIERSLMALASALIISSLGLSALAQPLDVPFVVTPDGQMAGCASSVVAGLDPNGDGFLAVRSGPGTQYQKIGEVYNGDIVGTCDARGPWIAITHGQARRKGWVHGRWLRDHAG
ncbi:SH3 domain-containing protein [Mesorhizobium sp. CAU 1741]|uniref:SH3 domain-containing protein n=1 Tax=Mesorhizobium sp. CAU 1741 TaxID=3140366 RepID=UPI00325B974D